VSEAGVKRRLNRGVSRQETVVEGRETDMAVTQRAGRQEGPSTGTIMRIVLVVAGVLALLYAAYLVRSILVLVAVSAFLAIGLDPAVRRLEQMQLSRGQAVATIFVAALVVIAAFVLAVIPPLVAQVSSFVRDLPGFVSDIASENPRLQGFVAKNDIPQQLQDATKDVPKLVGGSFGGVVGVAGSIIGTFFTIITVLVLTIYFLLSLSRIRAGTFKLIPKSKRPRAQELADPLLGKIGGYIEGQLTVALLAGVLASVFFLIMRFPFFLALALWVFLASLIPLVGATIGAIPAIIVAFFISVTTGLVTVTYFLIYQQVENYVLAPRIMKRAVDVSPAAILLAALIGGTLLGFVGALMAIPAAASLKLITQEIIHPMAESH
jgi:predicted PurR-regulated permease PerM